MSGAGLRRAVTGRSEAGTVRPPATNVEPTMPRRIDYFFSIASPWVYLGHPTFVAMARRLGAEVVYKPVLLAPVFDRTGGLPLPKRHPARQRYRLFELQRWAAQRGMPLNLAPRHSPFDVSTVDRMVIAIVLGGGDPSEFIARAGSGVWAEERDLADPQVLIAIAGACGLDGERLLELADAASTEAIYVLHREEAVEAGVFGAPSFVVEGEVFWGQDRIEQLEAMLTSGRPPFTA